MPTVLHADTLCPDTALIHAFQQDAAFDYQRELVDGQVSLWEWLMLLLNGVLSELFGSAVAHDIAMPLVVALALVVTALLVWLLWRNYPELFFRSRKLEAGLADGADTIYGIDFDSAVSEAAGRGDYRQAVRYVYLQTLRHLSDRGLVDWQPQKTPSRYVAEYADGDFRRLTGHFLRVRYGNFEADASIYGDAVSLRDAIVRVSQSATAAAEAVIDSSGRKEDDA